jgi:hypothetical protein
MGKNTARYLFFGAILLILIPGISASQFTRIGGGLTFSPGVDNNTYKTGNPGFNARAVIDLADRFWAVPSLTFYVPKSRTSAEGDKQTSWFFSFDGDILFTLATEKTLLFYALAGFNVTNLYSSFKPDDLDLDSSYEVFPGLNIGTGIEMIVADDINAFTQIKYVVGKYQHLAISIGVHYYISGRRFNKW